MGHCEGFYILFWEGRRNTKAKQASFDTFELCKGKRGVLRPWYWGVEVWGWRAFGVGVMVRFMTYGLLWLSCALSTTFFVCSAWSAGFSGLGISLGWVGMGFFCVYTFFSLSSPFYFRFHPLFISHFLSVVLAWVWFFPFFVLPLFLNLNVPPPPFFFGL